MQIYYQHYDTVRGFYRVIVMAFCVLTLGACVAMPPNDERVPSFALEDTNNTALGATAKQALQEHDGKNGALLLGDGLDAFVARAALAKAAQRTLDVQYYLFHRDLTGRLLINELLKAADRGVRVRLLVDDMDMGGRDSGTAALEQHPNVEVRLFNPFARNRSRTGQYVSRFGSVTRRMHNKSFTADNQMTILGGRNIGDEYFSADPGLAFADMDVLLAGPAAREVSASFDLYWNSELSYSVGHLGQESVSEPELKRRREDLHEHAKSSASEQYIRALETSQLAADIEAGTLSFHVTDVEIYYDKPEKITAGRDQTDLHLSDKLAPYFADAQSEVVIVSPYFVPGKSGTKDLCAMSARGVDVTILTNSLASTDVSVVHAGYIRYRKKLLRCGVHIFEANSKIVLADQSESYRRSDGKKDKRLGLSRSILHAKMFVFDRQKIFIGSLNLDPRSVTENTEIGAVIYSTVIGTELAKAILDNAPDMAFAVTLDDNDKLLWTGREDGVPVRHEKEPHTSFFKRLGTQIMRILPIESQI